MKKGLLKTIKFPIIFVLLIWVVKIYEYYFDLKLYVFGVFPREIMGLRGILCAPFIHNDFTHLLNNSVPILILGSLFIFFYKNLSFEILLDSILFVKPPKTKPALLNPARSSPET